MLDKISWLHISDFHFKAGGDNFSQKVSCDALMRDIPTRLSDEFPLQFIVVTGDIAYSGKSSEYEIASTFFASLLDELGLDTGRLCIVPGNHDVDRSTRPYTYEGVQSRLGSQWDVDEFLGLESERALLMERQSAFRAFRKQLLVDGHETSETDEGLASVRRFDLYGFRVCVLELNSAWLSGDKDHQGSLLVGERQIINALAIAENFSPHLTVALTHHPTDWLAEFDRIACTNRLVPQVDVFHSGHLHMHQAFIMLNPGSQCLHSAAGSSHETRHYKNSYNLLEYHVGDGACRIRQFEYRTDSGSFQELPGIDYELPPRGEIPATPAEVANALRETVLAADPYAGYMASLLTGGTEEVPIKLYSETTTFASKRFRPEHQIPEVSRFLRVSNLLKIFDTVPLDQTIASQEDAISDFVAFLGKTASTDEEFANLLSAREMQAVKLLGLDSVERTSHQEQYLEELANSGELDELIDTAVRYTESSDEVVRIAARRHLASAYLQQDDSEKRNEGSDIAFKILDEDWAECKDYLVASVAAESIGDSSLSESIALRALEIWPDDPDLRAYCRSFAMQRGSQTLRKRLDETGGTGLMANNSGSFAVGIEFSSVLEAISKQIYDTPYAFLRENLQNAIDASRMQARRVKLSPGDPSLRIDIDVQGDSVRIQDRGNGMSSDDLRHLYWTIGASGKRNEEARAAGCVGMFGIGGFANLGVCEKLVVISQTEHSDGGNRTELGRSEINSAVGLPQVALQPSTEAFPRGTIVEGKLTAPVEEKQLRQYIEEIVRYCREPIYFNDNLISGEQPGSQFQVPASIGTQTWSYDGIEISGKLFRIDAQTLGASLEGLSVAGEPSQLSGALRFEGDGIDIRKQGFKLCSHTVNTRIDVSGFIDCNLLSPTAGRDSLNAESSALVAKIVAAMEREAALAVLGSSDLIEQHTRIFRYVRTNGLVGRMGNVTVQSHGGLGYSLDELKVRANNGAQIYFGTAGNAALTNVLHSQGHIVVYLPSDNHKAAAIRDFLGSVGATDLKGQVELVEQYADLNRFEKAFLAELSETISNVYQVNRVTFTPGCLTENIPIYVANPSSSATTALRIFVDVRHQDVKKLAQLGITSLFRSMVSAFCREYLGSTLRSRSPKFFGSGAVNLDWLAKNRSETWILLTDDIAVVNRAVRRDVVRAGDVRVVTASPGPGHIQPNSDDEGIEPKLLKIIGAGDGFAGLDGYYLRIPNSASVAYGDVIVASDDHGAVWMGNKILLLASDGLSSAFQFEIRLDRLLLTADATSLSQGAVAIEGAIRQLFGGLYFPLPPELEDYLVPTENREIRIEVLCDWLDFASSRSWEAREVDVAT